MAYVYWIHNTEHSDMFSQGYIGFTSKDPKIRWKKHIHDALTPSTNRRNWAVQNAIRKYLPTDEISMTVLVEGSDDYCLNLEYSLRPERNIGWNINVGGDKPTLGCVRSEESKRKQSISATGKVRNKEHCKNISAALKGKKKSEEHCAAILASRCDISLWRNPKAQKWLWAKAQEIELYYLENRAHGACKIANHFNTTENRITKILKALRRGWRPSTDADYLEWLSEYLKENNGDQT